MVYVVQQTYGLLRRIPNAVSLLQSSSTYTCILYTHQRCTQGKHSHLQVSRKNLQGYLLEFKSISEKYMYIDVNLCVTNKITQFVTSQIQHQMKTLEQCTLSMRVVCDTSAHYKTNAISIYMQNIQSCTTLRYVLATCSLHTPKCRKVH